MKFGVALAGAALALFGASAAQAQLTITLTSPVTLASGALQYGGTINNPSSGPVTIQGANLGSPIGVTNGVQFFSAVEGQYSDGTNNPGLSQFPLTLVGATAGNPTGGFYQDTDLFELIVPAGTPVTQLSYSLTGTAGGGQTTLGTVNFTVGAPNGTVPEPGSVALLASGLVGSGLFVSRRRRK